ncbi:MAG: hypothetical protein JST61_17010 [Acidobacteria bacterium]|nr:hypothetical protein [Acidobacteriota bacterium]
MLTALLIHDVPQKRQLVMLDEEFDRKVAIGNRTWKFVLCLATVLSIAALPHSRYHDALKMAVWSVIFLGMVVTYAWPFIVDILSCVVVVLIIVFHFPVMLLVYPHLPPHGYLMIGLVIAVEYAICIVPIAWLDTRSKEKRRNV